MLYECVGHSGTSLQTRNRTGCSVVYHKWTGIWIEIQGMGRREALRCCGGNGVIPTLLFGMQLCL